MIWTFLLGMIAGAVGIVVFGNWFGNTKWYQKNVRDKINDKRSGRDSGDMDGLV